MENNLEVTKKETPKYLENTKNISQVKHIKVLGIINKIRIVQGWNMISPKDAEPVCAVWLEQLDRFKVHPELYEMLFNRVIDARVECLRKNESQPTLTVDLFLAEFCKYRDDIKKEVGRLQDNDYTVSEIHQANLLKIRNMI